MSPADVYASWRRTIGCPPFILGHRGARHAAPENTLAAFELARDEGADGIELDVRLSGDGNVVVVHDATLERVSQGRDVRRVDQLTRAELDAIDVGDGERVPNLRRVLSFCQEHSLRVNVELKSDLSPDLRAQAIQHLRLVQGCAALVKDLQSPGEFVLFSSFNPLLVAMLRRLVPDVPGAWLVHQGQARMLRAVKQRAARSALKLNAVHPQGKVTDAELVSALHAQGSLVNVWTVNDSEDARRLDALGVDALISDCPGQLRQSLNG
ncbi:MAG: glycerophosphodiester phosphodiesterase [Polyangiaceae bacterium]|nr:glycerophosphodiester phosphodiesterase [Myxococcales bacterium]MCB9584140.1 glycerophosphodiester phosphodiesterase [Polyangiaceae bacterium]MCB9608698.1 glycerophosphodiester phosphodiesterase [Polyangiaceae bacterium]